MRGAPEQMSARPRPQHGWLTRRASNRVHDEALVPGVNVHANGRSKVIVQLAASPFVGGPERQMLGLACHLPAGYRAVFVAFADRGCSRALLDEARRHGLQTVLLRHDTPHYGSAIRELSQHLRRLR